MNYKPPKLNLCQRVRIMTFCNWSPVLQPPMKSSAHFGGCPWSIIPTKTGTRRSPTVHSKK